MGLQSKIEWCDGTFNPWIGCTKVSPACDNCYAERLGHRFGVKWGARQPRHRTTAAWTTPELANRNAERWFEKHGRPYFLFCASLADVFDREVDPQWRADLFDLIHRTDKIIWLLLTKRPQNMIKMLPSDWGEGWPHVWLGTTAEDQKRWDQNLGPLCETPAVKHFVSVEPMLEQIDIGNAFDGPYDDSPFAPIDWVIAGGESGSKARALNPRWVRWMRDECAAYDVPFFFKQWGEYGENGERMGKEAAGNMLDGRYHEERPEGDVRF